MAKFKRKDEFIDAVQWHPGDPAMNKKYAIEERGPKNNRHGFSMESDTPVVVNRDWLTFNEKGLVVVIPDAEFRKTYQPA